jgi:hypothetical protein
MDDLLETSGDLLLLQATSLGGKDFVELGVRL